LPKQGINFDLPLPVKEITGLDFRGSGKLRTDLFGGNLRTIMGEKLGEKVIMTLKLRGI